MRKIQISTESYLLLLGALLGSTIFVALFLRSAPTAKLHLRTNRGEAMRIARSYLDSLGYDVNHYERDAALRTSQLEESYLQSQVADETVRQRLAQHRPPTYWEVLFRHPEQNERFQLIVTPAGRLVQFEHVLPPHVAGEQLDSEAALQVITRFLTQQLQIGWENYTLVDAQIIKREARTDHTFKWEQRSPIIGNLKLLVGASLIGGEIGSWNCHVEVPREFAANFNRRLDTGEFDFFDIATEVLVLIFFVIGLIVFVLRFNAGEVSIRNALYFAGFTFVVLVAHNLNVMPSQSAARLSLTEENQRFYELLKYVNLALVPFLASFSLFLVWASGESMTRELWRDKLTSFDAIFVRRLFSREIGEAILRGMALATILLGLWYAAVDYVADRTTVWLLVSKPETVLLSAALPLTAPLLYGIFTSLFVTAYAPLFSMSYFTLHFKRIVVAIIATTLLFNTLLVETTSIISRGWQAGFGVGIGVITYLAYLRYDLLTVAVAIAVHNCLPMAMTALVQPDPTYRIAGGATWLMLSGLATLGYVISRHGRPIIDRTVAPVYVRHLSERERLKMELDIARRTQLKMLPQGVPQIKGIEIAALCEPAREVGGDYYDFIPLAHDRLGIFVGDVSGKGMPAALYMTLMKGFLQGQAHMECSPRNLLINFNRSFYQSTERNTFVSLFYGVLDTSEKSFQFARAGHTPVILHRPSQPGVQLLRPAGIALGLENGSVFERVLEQQSLSIDVDDTLIFYTDGLTEAMNTRQEEFGEQRLYNLIAENGEEDCRALLRRIQRGYRSFIGRADPHDDLTCIVVRIT